MRKSILLVICLLMILTIAGCKKDPAKDGLKQEDLWQQLAVEEGQAWSSGEYNVIFTVENGEFYYNQVKIHETARKAGKVSDYRIDGENKYSFVVSWPHDTLENGPVLPEFNKTVELEYNPSGSKRIRVQTYLDFTDESQHQTYRVAEIVKPVDPTPVDPTPVDPTPVDPTPVDPTPVDPTDIGLTANELWTLLAAADSWTNEEDEFVDFDFFGYDLVYYQGAWDAGEGLGQGTLTDMVYEGKNVYVAKIQWLLEDHEEESTEVLNADVRIVYDRNEPNSIKVTPYDGMETQYQRDVNSQLNQQQVWEILKGTWVSDMNDKQYSFVQAADTGELYIDYKEGEGEARHGTITDFHGQHYQYTFAMIMPPKEPEGEEEVMYSMIILYPASHETIDIDGDLYHQ